MQCKDGTPQRRNFPFSSVHPAKTGNNRIREIPIRSSADIQSENKSTAPSYTFYGVQRRLFLPLFRVIVSLEKHGKTVFSTRFPYHLMFYERKHFLKNRLPHIVSFPLFLKQNSGFFLTTISYASQSSRKDETPSLYIITCVFKNKSPFFVFLQFFLYFFQKNMKLSNGSGFFEKFFP